MKRMNTNYEYYRIFYYVAKYGNLTKAAATLQTSQPAVTRTIHKLEDDLGCRLFIRSKSGMELTSEGQTFFEYVSAGCAQFFKGEQKLTNLLSLDEGSSPSVRQKQLCTAAFYRQWKLSMNYIQKSASKY